MPNIIKYFNNSTNLTKIFNKKTSRKHLLSLEVPVGCDCNSYYSTSGANR